MAYQEFDVENDQAAAAEMIRISNARSVPVIVIGDAVILGFDPARIDAVLQE